MTTQQTVLVTGSTGTVGTEVIRALVQAGVPVRATYNSARSRTKLEAMGVAETVQLDISSPSSLEAAFQGVTRAFLLVPFDPKIMEQGRALTDAARQAGVEYVVRLSGFGATAESPILVGQWHGQLDDHLKASGLPHTIVQPNFFMQNFTTFYGDMIRSLHAIYIPYGEAAVSWVDARDIGGAIAHCLQNPTPHLEKTYVLTGPAALTTSEIAALFSQSLGRSISYVDVPEATATTAMEEQGMPAIIVQALTELNGVAKAGYSALVTSDVETITGKPAIPMTQFIQDYRSVWLT